MFYSCATTFFDQVFCHISSSASINRWSAANLASAWREIQPNKKPGVFHIFEPLMDLEKEKEQSLQWAFEHLF